MRRPPGGCRAHPLLAAAVALVVATGCTSPSEVDLQREAGPRDEVQDMLRERGRRLADGDVEAYLRPMAPQARTAEEPIARGAAAVPLAGVDLVVQEADFEAGGTKVTRARVDFVHRYDELPPDNVFRFRLNYELEERDGAWVVTRSEPDLGAFGPPPVWATGPIEVARSPHFLAFFRPGLPRLDEALRFAEEARTQLDDVLEVEADPKHLMLLARNHEDLLELTRENIPEDALAAASYRFRPGEGLTRLEGRQMMVNLEPVLETPTAELAYVHGPRQEEQGAPQPPSRPGPEPPPEITAQQVFRHELGHLALTRLTRPSTPGWVKEGGAMALSGERRIDSWKELQEHQYPLPSFSALSRYVDLANGIEYAYVNAAVLHLIETFGADRFWEFYRDFKEYDSGVARPLEDVLADGTHRLLRRKFNLTEEQLDERTREWMDRAVASA